jgi:putative membrane protein
MITPSVTFLNGLTGLGMSLELLAGTIALRPYVFAFLAAFLAAGALDLGWRRTLRFGATVSPLVWLAEFTSTRTGIPFGLYHYTGDSRERELFVANVPLMDPLSFSFLAYASFCLARTVLRGRRTSPLALALVSGVLMMLLDVVIDPLAVRGEQWFLGHIFYYAEAGVYFGVPLSNFVGWALVGTVGVGAYLGARGRRRDGPDPATQSWGPGRPTAVDPAGGGPAGARVEPGADPYGRRAWPGIALYYAVLAFNLGVTAWIGEWGLLLAGLAVHVAVAAGLWMIVKRPAVEPGLEKLRA